MVVWFRGGWVSRLYWWLKVKLDRLKIRLTSASHISYHCWGLIPSPNIIPISRLGCDDTFLKYIIYCLIPGLKSQHLQLPSIEMKTLSDDHSTLGEQIATHALDVDLWMTCVFSSPLNKAFPDLCKRLPGQPAENENVAPITCGPQRPNNVAISFPVAWTKISFERRHLLKNLLLLLRLFLTTTDFWHNIWPQLRLCRLAAFWMVAKRSPCHPDTYRKGSCI